MTDKIVTDDWSEFGWREKNMAIELLVAWRDDKTERDLDGLYAGSGVRAAMNKNSGYVFLTNDEYEAFMLNGDSKLDIHLNCPECGNEGFPPYLYGHPNCDECKKHAMNYMDEEEAKQYDK